jgi:hypothetical protein
MAKEMTQATRAEFANAIRRRYKGAVGKATRRILVHGGHRLSREVRDR